MRVNLLYDLTDEAIMPFERTRRHVYILIVYSVKSGCVLSQRSVITQF